ncbi:MAG: hypothetical protein SGILL_001998 [Bacillariaceae sp.]
MPLSPASSSASAAAAANARLAQQKQRTKFLLYLLAISSCIVVGKQSFRLQSFVPAGGVFSSNSRSSSSRYLPESKYGKSAFSEEQDEAYGPSALFVPSLDFRINGISQYDQDHDFQAHVYCQEFARDLKWEWWQKGDTHPTKLAHSKRESQQRGYRRRRYLKGGAEEEEKSTSKRLMIGVTAGYDDYAKLLEQAVWSARVYGQKWGTNVTVVTLQGTSFAPHGCKAPASHTTLNKIRLLFHAIDHSDDYDQVLLLDADAFVYDMDVDLTTLLNTKQHVVAGQPMPDAHKNDLWNIHSGATLWNLHHQYIASVALDWFERAKAAVVQGSYENDQEYLQETLKEHLEWQHQHDKDHDHSNDMVLNFHSHEFDFGKGTIVKQFVRDVKGEEEVYSNANIPQRLEQMYDAAAEVCAKQKEACAGVSQPQYETG